MEVRTSVDDVCIRCGKPEKSRYKRAPNTVFICSSCVNLMTARRANLEEKKAEDEKIMKKRMKRAKRFGKRV